MTDSHRLPEASAAPPHPAVPLPDDGGAVVGTTTPGLAGQEDLEEIRRGLPGTLMERMAIEILEASAERVVGTMPVHGNTQPYGLLHGGASVVLAETLGSYGAMLHAGPDRLAVGLEVSATHHRAARDGAVTGTATAVHLGATTASYTIVVEDSSSKRICTARLTCLLIPRRPG